YDSHHRTAEIAGRTRQRGRVAARGARAAAAKDAAHRRATSHNRRRCRLSGLARGVPPGTGTIGLDHRTQRAHRNALGRKQSRRGDRMRRRVFITLLGGAAVAWPLAARGQQSAMPVIGYIDAGSPEPAAHLVSALRLNLRAAACNRSTSAAVRYLRVLTEEFGAKVLYPRRWKAE